jgi:hypothetical protein
METWQHRAWNGTTTDAHNNAVDSWADPVPLTGCMFDPGGSSEPGYGNRVVTTPTLYMPRRTVNGRDQFVGRGKTWTVDGDPADWADTPLILVPLRRVEG